MPSILDRPRDLQRRESRDPLAVARRGPAARFAWAGVFSIAVAVAACGETPAQPFGGRGKGGAGGVRAPGSGGNANPGAGGGHAGSRGAGGAAEGDSGGASDRGGAGGGGGADPRGSGGTPNPGPGGGGLGGISTATGGTPPPGTGGSGRGGTSGAGGQANPGMGGGRGGQAGAPNTGTGGAGTGGAGTAGRGGAAAGGAAGTGVGGMGGAAPACAGSGISAGCGDGFNCAGGACVRAAVSCAAHRSSNPNATDGVYWISPSGAAVMRAYCDMAVPVELCTEIKGEHTGGRTREGSATPFALSSILLWDQGECAIWSLRSQPDGVPFAPFVISHPLTTCRAFGFKADGKLGACRYGDDGANGFTGCGFSGPPNYLMGDICSGCEVGEGEHDRYVRMGPIHQSTVLTSADESTQTRCKVK